MRDARDGGSEMAETEQGYTAEVDADVADCIEVLLDFERYPQWSAPITSTRVLSRDDAGRGRDVAFELDMKIRTVRYTLTYEYDLPSRLRWSLREGDVASVDGSYEIREIGSGRARVTCRQAIDVGFWIPGPLRRVFERTALRDSVHELKAAAERRAAARRA